MNPTPEQVEDARAWAESVGHQFGGCPKVLAQALRESEVLVKKLEVMWSEAVALLGVAQLERDEVLAWVKELESALNVPGLPIYAIDAIAFLKSFWKGAFLDGLNIHAWKEARNFEKARAEKADAECARLRAEVERMAKVVDAARGVMSHMVMFKGAWVCHEAENPDAECSIKMNEAGMTELHDALAALDGKETK